MASSNTVLRPRWVRAEHSRYLTEPGDAAEGTGSHPVAEHPWDLVLLCVIISATRGFVTDLFGHRQALGVGDRRELLLLQLLHGVFVISQIQLGPHQDDGRVGTMVSHLRVPLQEDHNSEQRTSDGSRISVGLSSSFNPLHRARKKDTVYYIGKYLVFFFHPVPVDAFQIHFRVTLSLNYSFYYL